MTSSLTLELEELMRAGAIGQSHDYKKNVHEMRNCTETTVSSENPSKFSEKKNKNFTVGIAKMPRGILDSEWQIYQNEL